VQRKDWLKWRLDRICASDVPILYGVSKYKKYHELLDEKVRQVVVDTPPNFVQQKGVELEVKLRAYFSLHCLTEMGIDDPFEAELVEHPKKKYMGASLDGFSKDKKIIMEAKYVGKKVLQAGVVPVAYLFQIYHQLYVSGAEQAYCVMGDGTNVKVIPVLPDDSFIDLHKRKCKEFWALVEANRKERELGDRQNDCLRNNI